MQSRLEHLSDAPDGLGLDFSRYGIRQLSLVHAESKTCGFPRILLRVDGCYLINLLTEVCTEGPGHQDRILQEDHKLTGPRVEGIAAFKGHIQRNNILG